MAKALAEAIKPTARVSVGEAIRSLTTKAPPGFDAAGDAKASLLDRARMRASTVRARASGALSWPGLRRVVSWLAALAKRVALPMRQVSFATRVLVAFSVVSVLALALISGRGHHPQAPRVVTTAPVILTNDAPPAASPTDEPPIEPPIEIDVELPPTPPSTTAPAKPRPARRGAEAKVASGKPANPSPTWQLLH
jgi:hypothetical protein